MNHALDVSMFWVGALFAFTPIIVGGTVIGIWWWMRKRADGADKADKADEAVVGGRRR